MSTLKTHNLQSSDSGSVNIALAPNAGMVVTGITTISNHFFLQKDGAYIDFKQTDGTQTGYIQSRTTDFRFNSYGARPVTFGTNDVERVRITSDGDVGVGTATPITSSGYGNLSLVGSNGGQVELKRLSGDVRHYIWGETNLNIGAGYINGSSTRLRFLTNGNNERFRISPTGNASLGLSADAVPTASSYNSGTLHLHQSSNGNYGSQIKMTTAAGGSNAGDGFYIAHWGGNNETFIYNKENTPIRFGTNSAERFVIKNDGDVSITNGNLVVASGHGIDFSATSNAASPSSASSELFDDYEEGSWTPGLSGSSSVTGQTYSSRSGYYTKIGNRVYCDFSIVIGTKGSYGGTYLQIVNLPFTINSAAYTRSCSTPIYFRTLNQRWCFLGLQQHEGQPKAYIFGVEGPGSGADGASNRSYPNGGDIANGTELTCSFSYLAA